MWPFKTNGILRRCVLPLAIRPRLPVLLVARVYGGIQLRPRSGKCSRNHDNTIDFGDKVNEPFWSCKWNHHFSVYDMNPEMEAVMEVYWQRRFAEEFVLWQREALGGTDGVLLLPGAPAPACFTSHLRPATSATITSCSIDSVAIVGGQGEKLMAVRGQQWWYLDSITWVRNAIATPSPPPRIYTYHPLYTMVPDHKVHLHRGSCWHR